MHITQALHRNAQQDPDAIATVCGDRTRTRRQSLDRVARFAGALRGLGVAAGDRVGILALNSDRFHEYLLAVPWVGAVVNPVNIRWSPAEIDYSLQESDTRVLLVDDVFAAMAPALRELWPGLATLIHCGDAPTPDGMLGYEELLAAAEPVDDVRRGGDDLYGLFYTGGTTGHPKGVMLSHRNILTSAIGSPATVDLLTPGGRLLTSAPMFHLAALTAWNMANLCGSTQVLLPMFTPDGVLGAIARHKITDLLLVPTMIQMVVDHPEAANHDLTSVRRLIYGASPISEAVLERTRAAMPSAGLVQAYGMTELSPIATLLLPADHEDPKLRRAAGRATAVTEVRIAGPEDTELPRGEVGEIQVRGDNVMLGYWKKAAETGAALAGGWMHTGDAGRMDERGYVYVVDRLKDMIITGGENVYSAEVENALSKHPSVAACAVIGVPDEKWGERVHAVVVLAESATTTADELRESCRTVIAGYKVPRSIAFVDALPVSAAGKILKRELRAAHRNDAGQEVG